jgi:hypothetical protein
VFQTSPWDLRILLETALLLMATGVLASWLPVRRAARVDPSVAMLT